MSLFDELRNLTEKLKDKSAGLQVTGEARTLLERYFKEANEQNAYSFDSSKTESLKAILDSKPETQIEILKEVLRLDNGTHKSYGMHVVQSDLTNMLLRRSLPLSEKDIVQLLIYATTATGDTWYRPSWALLAGLSERFVEKNGLPEGLKSAIESFLPEVNRAAVDASSIKTARRFSLMIANADQSIPFAIDPNEAWGAQALKDLRALDEKGQEAWRSLLLHATNCSGTNPTNKWMKPVPQLIDATGMQQFIAFVEAWLPLIGKRGTSPIDNRGHMPDRNEILSADSVEVLKGLAWMCVHGPADDVRLARALGDAAEASFKKVRNLGARCPKVGNACVHVLSNMTSQEAIAQLGRLKARVKDARAKGQIEKAMSNAAARAGLSVQDLEELNVPIFGFSEIGKLVEDFGSHKVEITIDGLDVHQNWFDASGKGQKSIPSRVKSEHADQLKALKKIVAEVEKLLPVIRQRIESSLMEQRTWTLKSLRERYLDHPIAATIARRLIWRLAGKTGIWLDGGFVDVDSNPIDLASLTLDGTADGAMIQLWHPISSTPEEVLAWRQWLRGHEITQPFKQAHREIYVLTAAEEATRTYSNRFAAHIIRQHQFSQLCKQRGWKYRLQGMWDSHNTPVLELPQWGLAAEFWIEAIGEEASDSGIYMYCSTDQVRFKRGLESIPLSEIMPLVFTEVMRDVDLFVGVSSIGNDPNWGDRGDHRGYWESYSFGELSATATTRKQALQEIVPALKIAPRCQFDDKFLIVRGNIRTYKIHLGSGNILMEPNDEYLCIVPDRSTRSGGNQRYYLPFEGDSMLGIILSKAFLLADDTRITDPTIVRQLERSGIAGA